jgi:polysaccharide pyruvyl transferase CsaB
MMSEHAPSTSLSLQPVITVPRNGEPQAIGICGSYGGLNLGDEAILTVALEQLRIAVPHVELTVFTRDVCHTRAHHDVDRAIDARTAFRDELVEEIERLDLLLLGGGGILYDRESESYLHVPRIAQALGVPTATYAIGAGPLERYVERQAVADVLNRMVAITVRDLGTRRLLEQIGVTNEIFVTADPALLLQPAPAAAPEIEWQALDRERHLVGMSVREPGGRTHGLEVGVYHRLLADAADFVAERFDANLVFVPMERQDIGHAHRVIAEMGTPDRAWVLKGTYGPREVLGMMGELDLAIGMRLHFVIFAALAGVPVLALPYAAKVGGFLERLGVPTPQMVQRAHAGVLLAAIDRMWDLRDEHRRFVDARMPAMRDESRRTASLIAGLLAREVPRAAARPA